MGVLLQAFYNSVPVPTGADSSIRWWWDHLTSQATRLSTAGFSAVVHAAVAERDSFDRFEFHDK